MRVLVLEPFAAGSHASLYRGWQRYSCHDFTILELPAVHWKWRSRHSCFTLASEANARIEAGEHFDVIFASDMLSLAEWRGFACPELQRLPSVVYFHENQFSYPVSPGQKPDYHLAYSNVLSTLCATQVWFNSDFHRQEFRSAADEWLRRMPDYAHRRELAECIDRSQVMPPGIDPDLSVLKEIRTSEKSGATIGSVSGSSPVVGWVARWEHDKRPDRFVNAMLELIKQGVDFQLVLLGQTFRKMPDAWQQLQDLAGDRIVHQGFAGPADYWKWLQAMDVVVSTADHEFFGIAIVEAIWSGAWPILPRRLAYPEVIRARDKTDEANIFYDSDPELLQLLKNRLLRPELIQQNREAKTHDLRDRFGEQESSNSGFQRGSNGEGPVAQIESLEGRPRICHGRGSFDMDGYLWRQLAADYDRQLVAVAELRGSVGTEGQQYARATQLGC